MNELEQQFQEKLEGFFVVRSITNVNHKPHRYVIGARHVGFASNNYGGMLSESALTDSRCPKCAHPYCILPYKEHTSDRVLMLSLVRNLTNEEAQKALQSLPLKENEIDGVCFVETPEKFRML